MDGQRTRRSEREPASPPRGTCTSLFDPKETCWRAEDASNARSLFENTHTHVCAAVAAICVRCHRGTPPPVCLCKRTPFQTFFTRHVLTWEGPGTICQHTCVCLFDARGCCNPGSISAPQASKRWRKCSEHLVACHGMANTITQMGPRSGTLPCL
jgi:hypothetical protein